MVAVGRPQDQAKGEMFPLFFWMLDRPSQTGPRLAAGARNVWAQHAPPPPVFGTPERDVFHRPVCHRVILRGGRSCQGGKGGHARHVRCSGLFGGPRRDGLPTDRADWVHNPRHDVGRKRQRPVTRAPRSGFACRRPGCGRCRRDEFTDGLAAFSPRWVGRARRSFRHSDRSRRRCRRAHCITRSGSTRGQHPCGRRSSGGFGPTSRAQPDLRGDGRSFDTAWGNGCSDAGSRGNR